MRPSETVGSNDHARSTITTQTSVAGYAQVATFAYMVNSGHERLSVMRQCSLLISRSGLHYEKTGESAMNLALMQEIDRAFTEWPFLGVRQMCRYLASLGCSTGRKRVRRLMRLMGLMTMYQKPRTSISNPEHKRYPLSVTRFEHRQEQSGLVRGHYIYSYAQRLPVSGRCNGLAQPKSAVLAPVQYHGCRFLCLRPGRGLGGIRHSGYLQHGSRQPIYQFRLYKCTAG